MKLAFKRLSVQLIHTAHAVQLSPNLATISTYAQLELSNRFSAKMATMLTRDLPLMVGKICARCAVLEPIQSLIQLAALLAHLAIFATVVPTQTRLFQSLTIVVKFALRELIVPRDLTKKNFALLEPTTRMLVLDLLKSVLSALLAPQTISTVLKDVPLVANSPQVMKVLASALALERTEFTLLSITRADADQVSISRTLTASVRVNPQMLLTVSHLCSTVAMPKVRLETHLVDARKRTLALLSVRVDQAQETTSLVFALASAKRQLMKFATRSADLKHPKWRLALPLQ
jgi:hypothetical protein